MSQSRWSIGVGALAVGGLVAVGGNTVGHLGLDAAAPALMALVGALALGFAIFRQAVWRRIPAPMPPSAPRPRRIGGPRVF